MVRGDVEKTYQTNHMEQLRINRIKIDKIQKAWFWFYIDNFITTNKSKIFFVSSQDFKSDNLVDQRLAHES